MGAFLLAILAGCTTVSNDQSEETAPGPDQSVALAPATPAGDSNMVSAPASVPQEFPIAPPAAAAASIDLLDTWVPLDRWTQENGFGVLRRANADMPPTYWFASSNGVISVKVGSELAYWNGTEYRLGFAPRLSNGRPYVNALDVQKNFDPLLIHPQPPGLNRVLVIDPGHGGTDNGASNVFNGHFEKEYTLDLARRLQSLLALQGWSVWLTRSSDVTLPLTDRVAFAEAHEAGFFLSLHFNSAYPDRQQSGLETYCLTPAGMPSSLTRGYVDDPSLVYPNNAFDRENLLYAMELHRALLKVNGNLDRGVRRARFLKVLQGQNRPAILVEGGYLSNPREAREIADPAYRQKLAEAVAQAFIDGNKAGEKDLVSQVSDGAASSKADGKVN